MLCLLLPKALKQDAPGKQIFSRKETLDIDRVNTYAASHTIAGWFAGLAWFAYSNGVGAFSWWAWVLLIVVGMFVASIVIGGGVALLMAGITKIVTGKSDGSIDFFAWGAYISPVLSFFCANVILRWFLGN